MRTRNSDTSKPAATPKKTPPARKATAAKSQSPAAATPSEPAEKVSPKTPASAKRTPPSKAQPSKTLEAASTPVTDSNTEATEEQSNASAGDTEVTPEPSPSTKRVTRRVMKRKVAKRTPISAKAAPAKTSESDEEDKSKEDESADDNTTPAKGMESPKKDVSVAVEGINSGGQEEQMIPVVQTVEDASTLQDEGITKESGDELPVEGAEKIPDKELDSIQESPASLENEDDTSMYERVAEMEEKKENEMNSQNKLQASQVDSVDEKSKEESEGDKQRKEDEVQANVEMAENDEDEIFIEPEEEDLHIGDDLLDNVAENKNSEAEHMDLSEAANERKIRKQFEVFVSGLDRDVVEDDVKKAFENVGEVAEVRLLKDPSTNRNRGFAFVHFVSKEHAKRAVAEMKNPVICGKRCSTAPSENNDVLFLGNICNTWTKEAIKQKLREYGLEGVEGITLVQDPRQEGLSRGFCFVQFACHADAMAAYKRLQKTDAIFGHAERTAKVAFAEPLREPDPDVMSQVKSVFIDGLPRHWDEDCVRENFKCYGEIQRITLARNMSSAKRKDFGFVDFTAHEAAVSCIEDVNTKEIGEGNSKARVRARLSNPMPKTQAVKGGMCGGFRIGRGGGGIGRGFGRSSRSFGRPNHQYQRDFYQHGRNQFANSVGPYSDFHDRRAINFGERRAPLRGPYQPPIGSSSSRSRFGGPRHVIPDRGLWRPVPPIREPIVPEEGYPAPYMGRHMDDPYMYGDRMPGMKRPFYMTDSDPGYMGASGVRPRFDSYDPTHDSRYRDTYGAGAGDRTMAGPGAGVGPGPGPVVGPRPRPGPSSNMYPSGYFGSNPQYGPGPHASFRGGNHSGGGYYY